MIAWGVHVHDRADPLGRDRAVHLVPDHESPVELEQKKTSNLKVLRRIQTI